MNGLRAYERDTSLPARAGDAALCPPSEAELVRRVNGVEGLLPALALEAHWEHARWKPHVSCAALAAVRAADGSEHLVTWKRYATDKAHHVAADRVAPDGGPVRNQRTSEDHDANTVWSVFPDDRILPGLPRALDVQRSCRLLAGVEPFAGLNLRHRRSRATLVRYKPERRAVVRLDAVVRDERDQLRTLPVGVRVLAPAAAERVVAARRVACLPRELAPELLTHESRTGLVLETWWNVVGLSHDDFSCAREAGRLLARLHALDVPAPATTRFDPASGVELALFEVDRELSAAAHEWIAEAAPFDAPATWVHGDVHPDQFARERGSGALRLLDWDATRVDADLVDLASFAADAAVAGAEEAEAEWFAGYREAGGRVPHARDLSRAVAAALVARAAGALRRVERDGVAKAGRCLELARRREGGGA